MDYAASGAKKGPDQFTIPCPLFFAAALPPPESRILSRTIIAYLLRSVKRHEVRAGRIALFEMGGFNLSEVGLKAMRRLWWRGRFPRSFLAKSDAESRSWQENFIQTFLERDIRKFGVQALPVALRRLWMMLAHYHGQIWNASELARSLGESHTTVKRHLDILTGALMVRQLQPWHESLGKSSHRRSIFAILGCCTRSWASPRSDSWRGIPSWAPPGKDS
jgi:predicted AAA+ superfamily ATPase